MLNSRMLGVAMLTLAAGALCSPSFGAGIYQIIDVGGGFAEATGVNNALQVTGTSGSGSFLWQNGTMTNLGNFGMDHSIAYDINDAGQIVGICWSSGVPTDAFMWTDGNGSGTAEVGEWLHIGSFPGSTLPSARAFAVNSAGQVAGYGAVQYGLTHGFVWSDLNDNGQSDAGEKIDLGTPGGDFCTPTDINDAGVVAGYGETASGADHGFVWDDRDGNGQSDAGEMLDLGLPNSYATAIGDDGTVAGYTGVPNQPFTWKDLDGDWEADQDEFVFLGTLGGLYARPHAVNKHGVVVGWSETGEFVEGDPVAHGWVYANGVMHDLNDLIPADSGWVIESADDINDSGAIVGYGTGPDGQRHAFLLVPEPAMLLLLAGGGVVGLRRRR